MTRRIYRLPTEPAPDSIRVCADCPLLPEGLQEGYVSPEHVTVMGLSQGSVSKSERSGIHVVRPGLVVRKAFELRDIESETLEIYHTQTDALVPVTNASLANVDLHPEDWEQIKTSECDGAEQGARKYWLFGPRENRCPILDIIAKHDSRDTVHVITAAQNYDRNFRPE